MGLMVGMHGQQLGEERWLVVGGLRWSSKDAGGRSEGMAAGKDDRREDDDGQEEAGLSGFTFYFLLLTF